MKRVPNRSKGRVFIGMSGGVDSSVSAALLKKEGYEVTGVFMKVWEPDFVPCTWRKERLDAIRVAALLQIPLLIWNFEREYKKGVLDYMIREYRLGRTPNPDVMCNREVKFGVFLKRALAAGADFVATGHYAQVMYNTKETKYILKKGVDTTKDQSYFLWTLGQKELSRTLFPVGGYKKSQVRALARKFNLPVALKKDSQGLCFVGNLDMKDFLPYFIKEKKGSVINKEGKTIGTHRGAYFYTIGERHGFIINQKTTNDAPYYVVAKDIKENTITVAHGEKELFQDAGQKEIEVSEVNFCQGIVPRVGETYIVVVRYHGEPYLSKITAVDKNYLSLSLAKGAVFAAGQSVVLYDGDECIGGGIIK